MPLFFPHYHINEVPLVQLRGALVWCFQKWGLPRKIKVDNGKPFGDPQRASVPELALWLIGLGIEVQWSRVRTPRDNATVERMQRTTAQWAEPQCCTSIGQLQRKLTHLTTLQAQHYKPLRLKGKTRRQFYPSLCSNSRTYHSTSFKIKRVYAYLQKVDFVRRVSKSGCFSFYSQSIYVGVQYKNQDLTIRLDVQKRCWSLINAKAECFACFPADNFSSCAIEHLKVCRKINLHATKLPVAQH